MITIPKKYKTQKQKIIYLIDLFLAGGIESAEDLYNVIKPFLKAE